MKKNFKTTTKNFFLVLAGLVLVGFLYKLIWQKNLFFKKMAGLKPRFPAVFFQQASGTDWKMVQFNATRRGASPDQPDPPYELAWRRDFYAAGPVSESLLQSEFGTNEFKKQFYRDMINDWPNKDPELILNSGQPIAVGGILYFGSGKNRVYALDITNGDILWQYQARENQGGFFAGGAYANGKVFFASSDGTVYALDALGDFNSKTTSLIWEFRPEEEIGGFLTAPAIADGKLFVGSDDGVFYALNLESGQEEWRFQTSAHIRNSAAVDENLNQVYFGASDLNIYALDINNGAKIWQNRLNGTLLEFFPVISKDGSTVFWRTSPSGDGHYALENKGDVILCQTAGTTAGSDNHVTRDDPVDIDAQPTPERVAGETQAIKTMLASNPGIETFYAIDANTGEKRFTLPILWLGGEGQPGTPPVVAFDGRVFARIRSYYSNYDDFNAYAFAGIGLISVETGSVDVWNYQDGSLWPGDISDEVAGYAIGGERFFFMQHNDTLHTISLDGNRKAKSILNTRDGVWYTYLRNLPFLGETNRRFLNRTFDERSAPSLGPVIYGKYVCWVGGGVVGCFKGN